MIKHYFKLLEHHKEVFGSEEPCSFNELLFVAEAPESISGINVMRYASLCSIDDFPDSIPTHEYKLTKSEITEYPYYELLYEMLRGNFICPLIFVKRDNGFVCIEGKHRFTLITMCKVNNIKLPKFPVLKVDRVEIRNEPRYPDKYAEWEEWMKNNSIRELIRIARHSIKEITKWD